MNDLEKTKVWISNPSRQYAEGLELYMKYKQNTKYDEYFNRMAVAPDAAAINLLRQKLIAIEVKLRANPAFLERKIIYNSTRQPIVGKQVTPPLKQKYINKAEKTLASSPAAKTDPNLLPDFLKGSYERIQAITPLIGGLHAKLKACDSESDAKAICQQLIDLDTEKREHWAKIDEFNGLNPEERNKVLNPNPNNDTIIALGKDLKTTRDSLNRKLRDIEKHRKNKKHYLAAKGEEKAKEYQQKIESLESEIAKLSGDNS